MCVVIHIYIYIYIYIFIYTPPTPWATGGLELTSSKHNTSPPKASDLSSLNQSRANIVFTQPYKTHNAWRRKYKAKDKNTKTT